jgi:hypothetical protein
MLINLKDASQALFRHFQQIDQIFAINAQFLIQRYFDLIKKISGRFFIAVWDGPIPLSGALMMRFESHYLKITLGEFNDKYGLKY